MNFTRRASFGIQQHRAAFVKPACSLCSCKTRHFSGVYSPNYSENLQIKLEKMREELKIGPDFMDFISNGVSSSGNALLRRKLNTPELKIQEGLQPLKDSFGRFHSYLRISLTEKCNLRCVYCMPEGGVELYPPGNVLSVDEVAYLANMFAQLGVTKIKLTGGEPTVRRDLEDIVRRLAAIPGIDTIGITTNGVNLSRRLPALLDAGLSHLNISLDTLHPQKFEQLTRRKGAYQERVFEGIDMALKLTPPGRTKLNCVVMRGMNDEELGAFAGLTRDRALDVRFIEWMPFDQNQWNDSTFLSFQEMQDLITEQYPISQGTAETNGSDIHDDLLDSSSGSTLKAGGWERLVDGPNDTSKWFRAPGHQGRVGFITSMSEHFCGSCNRLRLTADGKLKACLFGGHEVNLKEALRGGGSDEDVLALINSAVKKKKYALGGNGDMYGIAQSENRPMILIGG